MLIKDSINLHSSDKKDGNGKEIYIGFTEDFRQKDMEEQKSVLDSYLAELENDIKAEKDSTTREGMMMIHSIVAEIYQHILSGQLDLEEDLVVDVEPDTSGPIDTLRQPS